eukprot:1505334-Amphidinium_carterae.1
MVASNDCCVVGLPPHASADGSCAVEKCHHHHMVGTISLNKSLNQMGVRDDGRRWQSWHVSSLNEQQARHLRQVYLRQQHGHVKSQEEA